MAYYEDVAPEKAKDTAKIDEILEKVRLRCCGALPLVRPNDRV